VFVKQKHCLPNRLKQTECAVKRKSVCQTKYYLAYRHSFFLMAVAYIMPLVLSNYLANCLANYLAHQDKKWTSSGLSLRGLLVAWSNLRESDAAFASIHWWIDARDAMRNCSQVNVGSVLRVISVMQISCTSTISPAANISKICAM
jgi:hypothetical protein